MYNTVEKFTLGLKKAYFQNDAVAWTQFEENKQGATVESIDNLINKFPEIPVSLIELLKFVDGTYEDVFYFLGSDVSEYPYYLLSVQEIIKNKDFASNNYSAFIERRYEVVEIDEKITNDINHLSWLHFSDCTNNGGTSQLFIDFSPSSKGLKGQIVRFLHDPDEFIVIADSFEEYLKMLIKNKFDFINEYTIEL